MLQHRIVNKVKKPELSEAISGGQPARQPRVKLVEIFKILAAKCPLWVKSRHRLSAVERPLSAKIGNQTDPSLIPRVNGLANSLVGSRLEQRRW